MRVRPRPTTANPLWRYFSHNDQRVIHKWHHYFDVYHNHFGRFRSRSVKVLEIGVFKGGSLRMWRHYFGSKATIYGVDIDPQCKELEEEQIRVFIGDQSDRGFLRKVRREIGQVDIVIDDGGHTASQQIITFEELYPSVSPRGIYLVEDLHTSYWEEYGGGYRRQGTFMEFAKDLIDQLNAWHSRDARLGPGNVTKSATGLHFYDSIVVIEKWPNDSGPIESMTGNSVVLDQLCAEREAARAEGNAAVGEMLAYVAPGEWFILVDNGQWQTDATVAGRARVPFLERDGVYWGRPANDDMAIRELERLRRSGASFIAFGSPAFWWLDYYSGFREHLRMTFRCVCENNRLIIFDLRTCAST